MKRYHIYAWPVASCFVMSLAVAYYARETWDIGRGVETAIYLGGIVVGFVMGGLVDLGTGAASRKLVEVMTATGKVEQAPSFSYQESLVARGRYEEAADAYRAHLAEHPDDTHATLALADLHAGKLDDAASAEALFLRVRDAAATPAHVHRASESLIDLYRKTGQRGRLMAELARTAERYRGAPAGEAAKRALMELKAEEGDPS